MAVIETSNDLVSLAEILVVHILDHNQAEIIKILNAQTNEDMRQLVNTPIDDGFTPLEHARQMYEHFLSVTDFRSKDFRLNNTNASTAVEYINYAANGLAPIDLLPASGENH